MTLQKINLGSRGEELTVDFLKKQGYSILEKNYKTKLGEIDIIARESRTVCFIEVKTRTTLKKGTPFEAVTFLKKRKLSQIALSYLKLKNLLDVKARFDVVSVLSGADGRFELNLIKDAFELSAPYAY